MSSKNKKKNINIEKKEKNQEQRNHSVEQNVDSDMAECDRLLEQLDEMQQNEPASMSSKVKNLIQEDKEAIRLMNEKLKEIDNDELDYLDDEKSDAVYDDESKSAEKTEEENPAETSITETESDKEDEDSEDVEEEANLDFLANLNRDDRIRKKEPRKLHNHANDLNLFNRLVIFAKENTKNFLIGTAIAFLFIVLAVALVLDINHKQPDKKDSKSKYTTEFLSIDTTPMIAAINNYYAALVNGETEVVKGLLVDGESVTDEEVNAKCEEAKMYRELVGNSFIVTDCYVQKGLKDNEYIVYMKFQLQIKNIETPTVGIFTCYLVNKSTKDKVDYRISTDVNDKSTEVYQYIIKMSNCKNVTDLFDKVDKELEEACEKDADLKAIVDALEQNGNSSNDNSDTGNSDNTENDNETTEPVS